MAARHGTISPTLRAGVPFLGGLRGGGGGWRLSRAPTHAGGGSPAGAPSGLAENTRWRPLGSWAPSRKNLGFAGGDSATGGGGLALACTIPWGGGVGIGMYNTGGGGVGISMYYTRGGVALACTIPGGGVALACTIPGGGALACTIPGRRGGLALACTIPRGGGAGIGMYYTGGAGWHWHVLYHGGGGTGMYYTRGGGWHWHVLYRGGVGIGMYYTLGGGGLALACTIPGGRGRH